MAHLPRNIKHPGVASKPATGLALFTSLILNPEAVEREEEEPKYSNGVILMSTVHLKITSTADTNGENIRYTLVDLNTQKNIPNWEDLSAGDMVFNGEAAADDDAVLTQLGYIFGGFDASRS